MDVLGVNGLTTKLYEHACMRGGPRPRKRPPTVTTSDRPWVLRRLEGKQIAEYLHVPPRVRAQVPTHIKATYEWLRLSVGSLS